MKKIVLLVAVLWAGILSAQELRIYENNGAVRSVPLTAVDSIGFNTASEMSLYHNYFSSYYTNKVNLIDSVVFVDAPPRVDMFYCEFVPAGDELIVRGWNLFSPKVYFYDEGGNLIQSSKVRSTLEGTMMYVTVPEGATHSRPIVVETKGGATTSKILFRDRRNIIIDFDQYKATWGYSGTIDQNVPPDENGRCTWKDSYINRLPNGDKSLLPKGCDGVYGQLNTNIFNGWYDIIFYVPEEDDDNPKKSCVERFADDYYLDQLTLKFEVYVPKNYPINGMYGLFAFAPEGANPGEDCFGRDLSMNNIPDNLRIPGAWWVPFTPYIYKMDDGWWQWEIGKAAKELFYTDGWMTVSVPLSTFNKQTAGTHPLGVANYEGNGIGNDPYCKTPLHKDRMWNFAFFWEPWSSCKQEGEFLCFLDNFRIVPDDGGGAQFGVAGGITKDINTKHILETSSVVSVSSIDNDGSVTPLAPNTTVTVYGNRLDLVEKIIFANRVEVVPASKSTSQLSFTLPENASSGMFKLKVAVGKNKDEIIYVEARKIKVRLPVITQVRCTSQTSLVNLPLCSADIIISGEHFDRIHKEYPDGTVPVLLNGITVSGTINGNEITIGLPRDLSSGVNYSVMFSSFGEKIESSETFTIQSFVLDEERLYEDSEPIGANGTVTLYVYGDILCAVRGMMYRMNTDELLLFEDTMTPISRFTWETENDRIRLRLVNYKRGGEIILVLYDGSKIELRTPYYVQ